MSADKGREHKVRWSIRWIVAVAAAAMTTGATLCVGTVAERNMRVALTRELETRLLLDARTLSLASTGAMLGDYPELTLHPLAKEMKSRQPELSMVLVLDNEGRIQGHPEAQFLGSRFEMTPGLRPMASAQRLAPGEALRSDGKILLAAVPVMHPDGRRLGTAVVGMPRGYLESALAAARRQQALVLAALLIVGGGVAFLLMSQLLHPIGALRRGIERVGRGELDQPLEVRDHTELGLLASAINTMSAQLKDAQVELLERERLAHEMELARKIQKSLLPAGTARAGRWTIQGFHHPAAEVGGDFYDIFDLPGGKVGFAIADVSGKGLGGCLVMSMVYALLRAYRESTSSPSALLSLLDERLSETLSTGTFVTLFYGVLDPESNRLVFASAGHNPLLVYRASTGTVGRIATRGIPLGAVRGGAIRGTLNDQEVNLDEGDVLLQYTDGVTEAFDEAGQEQFGLDRLGLVLTGAAPRGSDAIVEGIVRSLREWIPNGASLDDETLLVVCREPNPTARVAAADGSRRSLEHLAQARARGRCLTLPADLDALVGIGPWLRSCPPFRKSPQEEIDRFTTALYEVCANVVEHGYAGDHSKELELWWIPQPGSFGFFLVRDQGVAFRPGPSIQVDFSDPSVRLRGRGLGLQIIDRIVSRAEYHAGTPEGNLTLLTFREVGGEEEVRRARAV